MALVPRPFNPNVEAKTERELGLRCPSSKKVRPGRTCNCKLRAPHTGPHTCICRESWPGHPAGTGKTG